MSPPGPLASAVATLFAVVDPIGTAMIFAGLVPSERPVSSGAARAAAAAMAILVAAALLGSRFGAATGRAHDAMLCVAGGVLMLTAILSGAGRLRRSGRGANPFLVPLAVPLLAGPGCIATTLALAAERSDLSAGLGAVLLAVVIVEATAWLAVVGAAGAARRLGPAGQRLVLIIGRMMLVATAATDFLRAARVIPP